MPRYEITTREAAKALETRAEYLLPFAHRARTQGDVADELGVSMQVMHCWVSKFCKAGLLVVDRETPRVGRAVRHYRAVASSFFIPAELLTQETFRSEGNALVAALVHHIEIVNPEIAFDAELRIDLPEHSTIVRRDYARRGYRPHHTTDNAVLWTSAELSLTPEQGRELKRRGMALLSEFEALADANPPGQQPHRAFIASCPIPH